MSTTDNPLGAGDLPAVALQDHCLKTLVDEQLAIVHNRQRRTRVRNRRLPFGEAILHVLDEKLQAFIPIGLDAAQQVFVKFFC